jgi:hypothetical protein
MDQELFDPLQEGSARLGVEQARAFKTLERCMDLRRAQRQVASHLSNRRTPGAVAHQFDEHDYVLGQQALWHSIF